MPGVLTTASRVTCAHGGTVLTESTAALTIQGSPVLLGNSIEGKSLAPPGPPTGCTTPPAAEPSGPTAIPCSAVADVVPPPPAPPRPPGPAVTAGASTVLTIGDAPVMLDTLVGVTNGMVGKVTPQPGLSATANQSALTAS